MAAASSQPGGSGGLNVPWGHAAIASRPWQRRSSARPSVDQMPAASAGQTGSSAVPASVAGSSRKVKTGMARAFARGPATGIEPKAAASTGVSIRVTAACDLAKLRASAAAPGGAAASANSAATAAKLSQKPAELSASGSLASITTAAPARPVAGSVKRLAILSAAKIATIDTVRSVGREAPASHP